MNHTSVRWLLLLVGILLGPARAGAETVFVSPQQAARLMLEAEATVIDARGFRGKAPYLPHATGFNWLMHRDGWLRVGRVSSDLTSIVEAFEAVGVANRRPVVVFGDMAGGWGDEGRVWWMLRYLGHQRVFIVDGGIDAWQAAGLATQNKLSPGFQGAFRPRLRPSVRVRGAQLHGSLDPITLIDSRSRSEYDGATPHFSSRGGHIPRAIHMEWSTFLDRGGRLKSTEAILTLLHDAGVADHQPLVTYCTGGIRAAFVHAVLEHVGMEDIATYDGSFWEWSAHASWPVE